ncbi:tripartite tricarboxylate transporter TctB family protein [Azospirillum sp. RWY-5-1]|uniref:Tripartite tricarboxylate transporter TctB family protein n=1 Tax=Azospirillum oleiclasticum TaxID=2735135 RepID=A0ABX2TIV6_9PROT|nr:tripartite tricarboxylate transporter TctB family protein [Azospirillum oleiclasticum]NYZ17147.1 tripartite tricarboxylate transporter TctB family protein [Azospirillum oleiclasticum]NYZ24284.1 tripartite tricarboxylate transporter TctB family protein [Azospirillum oleiclasticum]
MPSTDPGSEETLVQLPSPVLAHVEKLVADGLKRELDQEENVVRSLPFFATSIGALLALIGFVKPSLASFPIGYLSITSYILCFILAALLVALVFFLFHATKKREQYHPMQGSELIEYARELVQYHESTSSFDDTSGYDTVILDIRQAYTAQLATYAENVRGINLSRADMRAKMFSILVIAVIVALLLVGTIVVLERQSGGPHDQGGSVSEQAAHIEDRENKVLRHPSESGGENIARRLQDQTHSSTDAGDRDWTLGGETNRDDFRRGRPQADEGEIKAPDDSVAGNHVSACQQSVWCFLLSFFFRV